MQKNVLIALVIVGTLTAGFFVYRNRQAEIIALNTNTMKEIYKQWLYNTTGSYFGLNDEYRFKIFRQNYEKIMQHNSLHKSYTLALNEFACLTEEEFAALRLGLRMPKDKKRNFEVLPTNNLKSSVD